MRCGITITRAVIKRESVVDSLAVLTFSEAVKGTQFNDYILTKSVGVEQLGANNLPRVVTQPRPGLESNSRPLDRKYDTLQLRHHATP